MNALTHARSAGWHTCGLLIAISPLIGQQYLITVDGPDHLATAARLFKFLVDGDQQLSWNLLPTYQPFYFLAAILYGLILPFGYESYLGAVTLGVMVAIFYAGIVYLMQNLAGKHDKTHPVSTARDHTEAGAAAIAALSFYGPSLYWGFMSFQLAVALAPWCMAALERLLKSEITLVRQALRPTLFIGTLFAVYLSHPLAFVFIAVACVLRTLHWLVCRRKSLDKQGASTLVGVIWPLFGILILHYWVAPPGLQLEPHKIAAQLFRGPMDALRFVQMVVFDDIYWHPLTNVESSIETSILWSLGLCAVLVWQGPRSVSFPVLAAFLLGAFLHPDIVPARPPVYVFFNERMTSILFALAVAYGFGEWAVLLAQRPGFMVRRVSVAVLLVAALGGADIWRQFDALGMEVRRRLVVPTESGPRMGTTGGPNIYDAPLHTLAMYPYHWHLQKYPCVEDLACQQWGKFFFASFPDLKLYPFKFHSH